MIYQNISGGAAFFAAIVIETLAGSRSSARKVYMCDSFEGIPNPNPYPICDSFEGIPKPTERQLEEYNDELESSAYNSKILNENNVDNVKATANLLRIPHDRLEYVIGYFNETLPTIVKEKPHLQFSVLRLDGDTYFSTMDALRYLYPRLVPGGFVIVDDYIGE